MIELRGVSSKRGSTLVLDECDLSVAAGERVALLGASGAGKTTLLRIVAGLALPDAGTVLLDGAVASTPSSATAPDSRGVGLAFQEPALWPHLTIARHLTFGMSRATAAAARGWLDEVTSTLGLSDLADRYPGEISGGQARRVELARALARRPARLLLDEPLVHLDEAARDELRTAALRLAADAGSTVVWVTHDVGEARTVSERIVLLEGGRCVG